MITQHKKLRHDLVVVLHVKSCGAAEKSLRGCLRRGIIKVATGDSTVSISNSYPSANLVSKRLLMALDQFVFNITICSTNDIIITMIPITILGKYFIMIQTIMKLLTS